MGLVRKFDLLSKSLGLKTAVLAEPSDLNVLEFFLYKTHTRLAKKISRQILRFLTNFEGEYIPNKSLTQKNGPKKLLQIVSRF